MITDGQYEIYSTSKLMWAGKKTLVVDYVDTGSIMVKTGSFTVASSSIKTGEVVFDMNSINSDQTPNTKATLADLTKHLKSADWFDVAKYPTAKFMIKEVVMAEDGTLLAGGSLTIKDKTVDISVPLMVTDATIDTVTMSGKTTIDRTLWGITYGSGKFFQDLGDKVIADDIEIEFNLSAKLVK